MENPETQEETTDNISQMSLVGDDELSFIRNVGTKSAFFEREYK